MDHIMHEFVVLSKWGSQDGTNMCPYLSANSISLSYRFHLRTLTKELFLHKGTAVTSVITHS